MKDNRWVAILVALSGALILAYLYRFNQQSPYDDKYLVTNITALFWVPMVLVFLVIRHEPTAFGFALGDARRGYILAAVLFAAILPILIFAAGRQEFQDYYPIAKWAKDSPEEFLYFELTYGAYLFCWEFFFRGFLLFGLAKWIGSWSLLPQAIAFGFMHLGKPPLETAGSFVSGFVLGILALRGKSFVPCFLLHWAISVTFDVLVIMSGGGFPFWQSG